MGNLARKRDVNQKRKFQRLMDMEPYWLTLALNRVPLNLPDIVPKSEAFKSAFDAAKQLAAKNDPACLEIFNTINAKADDRQLRATCTVFAGIFLLAYNKPLEAKALFLEAGEIMPTNALAFYLLGIIFLHERGYEEAYNAFDKALALNPSFAEAAAYQAFLCCFLGEAHKAEELSKVAIGRHIILDNDIMNKVLFESQYRQGKVPTQTLWDITPCLPGNSADLLEKRISSLPGVISLFKSGAWDAYSDIPLLYLFCDTLYFYEYVFDHIYSLMHTGALPHSLRIWIHVCGKDDGVVQKTKMLCDKYPLLSLKLTYEDYTPIGSKWEDKTHFASARYFRAHDVLKACRSPLIVADVGMLFKCSLKEYVFSLKNKAVSLTHVPPEPLWQELSACFSVFAPCTAAKAYLREVAAMILKNLVQGKRTWLLDQVALRIALDRIPRRQQDSILLHTGLLDVRGAQKPPLFLFGANGPFHSDYLDLRRKVREI